jgi:hypothetical protein
MIPTSGPAVVLSAPSGKVVGPRSFFDGSVRFAYCMLPAIRDKTGCRASGTSSSRSPHTQPATHPPPDRRWAGVCLIEYILRQRNAESAEPSYADLVTEQLADRAVEVMRGLGISRPGPIAVGLNALAPTRSAARASPLASLPPRELCDFRLWPNADMANCNLNVRSSEEPT